jgi:hypothetical protein
VPSLRWDAAELELDTVTQCATAGVREFAPWAERQHKAFALIPNEMVAEDAVLDLLGAADDEEVLRLVKVDGEVTGLQLERGTEEGSGVISGDSGARAGDGGHHRALQHSFRGRCVGLARALEPRGQQLAAAQASGRWRRAAGWSRQERLARQEP